MKKDVAKLIALGYSVCPLRPKTKELYPGDFTKMVYGPEHFDDNDNVGIRGVGGIVVVDLDCVPAVAMADRFLKKTGAIYGRKSAPRSKRIYRSKLARKMEFRDQMGFLDINDKKKSMMIELRVGHYDMAPPSVHPNGESLYWDVMGGPLTIDEELLVRDARLLSTCSFICLHYNPKGNRHDWGMHLIGMLRSMGLTKEETTLVMKSAAEYVKDGEFKDREDAIKTTYNKAADEPISAAKALRESAEDPKFVPSLASIWGAGTKEVSNEMINDMNKIHAVLNPPNGRLILLTEDKDGDTVTNLRFQPLEVLTDLYNERVEVGTANSGMPIFKKKGVVWREHVNRRFYNGIELRSRGTSNGYYNLWQGFKVEPQRGEWDLYKKHLVDIVADGDSEHAKWIFNWMAAAVQEPEVHAHCAVGLLGGQGVGKSTFCEWFGYLFGQHFLELSSYQQLTGHFNSHLQNAVLVFADEAMWGGAQKKEIGNLRRMITQDTLAIERKGHDIITMPNHIHMMMASNADWLVHAHHQERRFAIFQVSEKYRNDFKFFGAVYKQLVEGGWAGLLFDLMEYPVDMRMVREVPVTEALQAQKELSLDRTKIWMHDLLVDGDLWNAAKDYVPGGKAKHSRVDMKVLDKNDVWEMYIDTMRNNRDQVSRGKLWKMFRTLLGVIPAQVGPAGGRKMVLLLPPLAECRETFQKHFEGGAIVWDDGDGGEEISGDIPF